MKVLQDPAQIRQSGYVALEWATFFEILAVFPFNFISQQRFSFKIDRLTKNSVTNSRFQKSELLHCKLELDFIMATWAATWRSFWRLFPQDYLEILFSESVILLRRLVLLMISSVH